MRRSVNTTSAMPKKYVNDGVSISVPSSLCSSSMPPQSVTAMYATRQIEKITRTSMTSRPDDEVSENGMKRLGDLFNGGLFTVTLSERLHFFINR